MSPITLGLLCASIVYVPFNAIHYNITLNSKYKQMLEDGNFRQTNQRLSDKILNALLNDWFGGAIFFPRDKIGFLKSDSGAMLAYVDCLVNDAIIQLGYKPVGIPTFNVSSYDPYHWYNENYAIKEYLYKLNKIPTELQKYYVCNLYFGGNSMIVYGNDLVEKYVDKRIKTPFMEWASSEYRNLKPINDISAGFLLIAFAQNHMIAAYRKLGHYMAMKKGINEQGKTRRDFESYLFSKIN